MIRDNLLQFAGTSNGTTGGITSGATTDSPTIGTQNSTNVIDLGLIGLPAFANGGGARDMGVGDDPTLKLSALVTTAFTGGTSLQLLLQGAPDNGSGAPGAYTTMWTGPAVVEANLIAGQQIANINVPRPAPGQAMPRFLRLQYVSVGTHTAGALTGEIVLDRDDQILGPGGQYSGYPAGITIPN